MSRKASKAPTGKKTGKRRKGQRPGRGTLMTISILLVGSAVIRLVGGVDMAMALDDAMPETAAVPMESMTCDVPEDIAPVLAALKDRETRLAKREAELKTRLQALNVADREISRRMDELTEAERALRDTIALADSAAEDDLSRLTAVYENMKAKEAAALFEAMAPEFAAGFMGRMRPDAAAGIMAGLSPETAYAVSVILAGRNANVPKE